MYFNDMFQVHTFLKICSSKVTIMAARKMKAAPNTSITAGVFLLIRTWATNATIIWDVLKVETVDGGIMIRALNSRRNPSIPANVIKCVHILT